MNLKEFIEKTGDADSAKLFGVKIRTVESWRRGERSPRTEMAKNIVSLTNGQVSFSECYESISSVA